MRKLLFIPLLLSVLCTHAQLLSWTPDFIHESSTPVTITMNAAFGNRGLWNYSATADVYVHIGVITSKSTAPSDWRYVKFTWGTTNSAAQCTYLGSNKWKYTISGGLRSYFGITDPTETIKKIAILFRNGNGTLKQANTDGSDMYVPVYDNGLYTRIDAPFRQPTYTPVPDSISKNVGDPLTITAKASIASTLKIYLNNVLLTTVTGANSANVNTTISSAGNQKIVAEAVNGSTARDSFAFYVVAATKILPLPAGVTDGINYEKGDTSVTLVLYAPQKKNVFVLGDFNGWVQSAAYQMNLTPDSNYYWIRLTHLTPGTEYAYQYLIDNSLRVADYNTEKILDPVNDPYIPATTYPNLKAYPSGKTTGIVSILQTAQTKYNWQATNFKRPDKHNLVIYELLVRDFVSAQNWQTVKDSLHYLKTLGINAIEVMPFNEFEGNLSWGYNPDFYFAPDKYYGTANALKQFIDECHKQGIAVIMDMVLNHSFGSSPMVQMYWDAANSRPAANSPWFNPVPKHAYNVGYDINHESQATIDFVNRVIQHWLVNYRIDGFRWDLSKGFTQKQTCDNTGNNCDVNAWSAYDASRIAIWKRYYGFMQAASAGSYCILEHFADNSEEKELSDNGMLLWGNGNYNYNQATMGYSTGWDFSYSSVYNTSSRGWSQPNLVGYQESHDEERLMYKNEQYGNSSGSYTIKTLSTGLKRNAMAAAFWSMLPGPKMLWQFGELGYDLTINRCSNGTVSDACRTDPKPLHWDYLQNADRKNLHDIYSKLLLLRTYPDYLSTFTSGTIRDSLSSAVKWESISGDSLKVMVMGNFDVVAKTAAVTFPATGAWYSYLTDSVTNIGVATFNVTLQPGEYYVFTNRNIKSVVLPVTFVSFTAQKTGKHTAVLTWKTADEINTDHYTVERSIDGSMFAPVGDVPASGRGNYSFTDFSPSPTVFYRIREVDRDGNESVSAVIRLAFDDDGNGYAIYPNPATDKISVHVTRDLLGVTFVLSDGAGKILYRQSCQLLPANDRVDIPVERLAPGIYFLRVSDASGSKSIKIMLR